MFLQMMTKEIVDYEKDIMDLVVCIANSIAVILQLSKRCKEF